MMNKLFFLCCLTLISIPNFAKNYTISGIVKDANSGESLPSSNIFEKNRIIGINSNTFGYYSISIAEGKVDIAVSYIGYETQTLSFILSKDTIVNVLMVPQSEQLDEVAIVGNRYNKVTSTQMSMIDMPMQKLQRIPVLMGEPDVLKVLQLLPGVQSGSEGSSGIYVRGGGPDQNLFLLDGVPVYNASHLFGFFSVFHPNGIKSVKLYKGGFPARYAGRLSSVVDIGMKEGNMQKYEGEVSVGLIASSFSLEGPIKKDKTSFIVAGRRTYVDILSAPFIAMANKDQEYKTMGGYYFYDLNAKINHKFSDKSRLYASGYFGDDAFYVKDESEYNYEPQSSSNSVSKSKLGWGNKIAALRWNYLINNKLFSNTTLTFSNYNFYSEFFDKEESKSVDTGNNTYENRFKYLSGIKDYTAKVDFDYFLNANHTLKFGTNFTKHQFKPGAFLFSSQGSNQTKIDETFGNKSLFSNEINLFAEDDFELFPRLNMNVGLNLAIYNVGSKTYTSLQPRISSKYQINSNMSIKASYARMAQFVHLLTSASISLPTDIWVPVTSRFAPPLSDQYAIGWAYNLTQSFVLSIEGYYKDMRNLLEYKDGASFANVGSGWEDLVEQGTGRSFGGEFMLEKNVGKTTGWIGYTLSKSDRQFEELNGGKVFPYKYDRRHDLSLVMTHEFSKRIDVGATAVYGTGNAVTLGINEYDAMQIPFSPNDYYYDYQPNKITDYNGRNSYRAPSYVRFDIGVNFRKQKKHGIRTWNISIYNASNRKNPFFLGWDEKYTNTVTNDTSGNPIYMEQTKRVLKKYSIFPIMPSISYSYKF